MKNTIEIKAKTVLDAIESAAEQLGVPQDELEIEILEQGGMFKKALVRASLKESAIKETPKPVVVEKPAPKKEEPKIIKEIPKQKKFEETAKFVTKLLELLGNNSTVTTELVDNTFNINISGENIGILIGKAGIVLGAIQTITQSIARNYDTSADDPTAPRTRVMVNIGDYRDRRNDTVNQLAMKKADYVKRTGRMVELDPMPARERAIIHTALQNISGIKTFSTGKEPHRKLCIAPADATTPKE